MRNVLGNPIVVFFFLVVFAPLGIFLMFTFTDWTNGMKMALATVFGIGFIVACVMTMQEIAQEEAMKTMGYIKKTM